MNHKELAQRLTTLDLKEPATRPLSAESDETLAVRAAGGSVAAFAELVRRHEKRIYNFLLRRGARRSEVEDLTQDAFVEGWTSIKRYNPKWRFSTWLFTIAFRQATASFRRAGARGEPSSLERDHTIADARDEPVQTIEARETRHNLWGIIGEHLEREHQIVLWLRYVEELSIPEIARVIGRLPVTTRVVLHRARKALETAIVESEMQIDDAGNRSSPSVAAASRTGGAI